MYVYNETEKGLYTVGHWSPQGEWHIDSDHSVREDAARRVAWLNGNNDAELIYKSCTAEPEPTGFIISGEAAS